MENSSLDKLSAYVTVASKFTALCQEVNLTPFEAWSAIGRLCDFGLGNLSSISNEKGSAPSPLPVKPAGLTKEEKKEAKEQFRIEKAKRLGLSPKEINLTPSEAQEAVKRYRHNDNSSSKPVVKDGKKENIPSFPPPREAKAERQPDSGKTGKEASSKEDPAGNGERSTSKSRLDNFRRIALKTLSSAIADSTVLHLFAYSNARRRLNAQWIEFKRKYTSKGLMNPMRNLPDPWDLPRLGKILGSAVRLLKVQKDSPETYVLMDENARSYWDRDRPDTDLCPPDLQRELDSDEKSEFSDAASAYAGN
jgi:hypothetical protein